MYPDPRTLQNKLVAAVRERWPLIPVVIYSEVVAGGSHAEKVIMLHVTGRNVEQQFIHVKIPHKILSECKTVEEGYAIIEEEVLLTISKMVEDEDEDD